MNQLAHKLHHFEQTPAEKNWAAIIDALEHQLTPVAQTLAQFQQTPPPFTWNKIETELQTAITDTPVVSFTQKHKKLFKYISAAAVLVLVASLITIFLTNSASKDNLALQPGIQKALEQPKNRSNGGTDSGDAGSKTEKGADVLTTGSGNETAKKPDPVKSKQARYITVAVESGKKVRLSKKAYTVFDCAENGAAQKSERCKENIEAMQQKMAASMLSPSGDFGGLIDILKSLEENE